VPLPRSARVLPFNQKYLSYPIEDERQRLPLLHIRLLGPGPDSGSFTSIALIDSGATATFIPPELAEAVGLKKVGENAAAQGAGGTFANDLFEYRIDLLKNDRVMLTLKGTAHVPREKDRIPYVVLGRDNLFLIYDITFRDQRQRVYLRPASVSDR
jgi:hypothetical protein